MDRVVGTLMLAVIVLLWVTGVVMLYGTWLPWLFDLHRIAGFSLIALIPFKITTISQSWLRGTGWTLDRKVGLLLSVVLAGWILLIIVLGISWMWLSPRQMVFTLRSSGSIPMTLNPASLKRTA